ncbi:response regulator transcription factor [Rhizobium sp. PL01]|uniref:response regulator transcription factor n=1 Tax=Rhizobium sp. PL01 TaxID=3085631 RepID=UPI002982A6FD|nr:response regulator transcription factor [Rhizobium sp. PL01]MDW5318249.1 response regulator transcription factor [Rhizobium sp. PL01]
MNTKTSVIVVDDHAIFRMGVVQALALSDEITVVGEGSSALDAVRLAETLQPDVALIDISMPGGGIKAAADIHQLCPEVKVLMLTVSEEDDDILQALDAGVAGYVLKGVPAPELIEIVSMVKGGKSYIASNLGLRLFNVMREKSEPDAIASRLSGLTPKQRSTFELLANGYSNRQIAERLGVQVKTIKFHMSKLFEKIGVHNRVEAALLAHAYLNRKK